MIKINLSVTKKQLDLSNVGGFDFSKIKIKAVLIAIVLIYLPDFFVTPIFEEEIAEKTQALTVKQNELRSLKRKVQQSAVYEKQIKELKAQEENLGKKLIAVKQAISEKKNPASLLLYIAKNMPVDLWIKELSITGESLLIKGEALSYTSVGNFVTNLRSSIFIKDSNIVNTTSTVRESDKKRIESFEVNFLISRFE